MGPFVYLFNDALTQVETQSWPRLAKTFFGNEFKLFDDIFLNTDGSLYFFSVSETMFLLHILLPLLLLNNNNNNNNTCLPYENVARTQTRY